MSDKILAVIKQVDAYVLETDRLNEMYQDKQYCDNCRYKHLLVNELFCRELRMDITEHSNCGMWEPRWERSELIWEDKVKEWENNQTGVNK